MKNRILILLFSALLLNTAQAAEEAKSDTLQYPADFIPVSKDIVYSCTSEDGKMAFYSWNTGMGGSMPNYNVVCRFRTGDGDVRTIDMPDEEEEVAWVNSVHSLKKKDGSTYYIAARSHRISSASGYMWMDAFAIVGDTIKSVSVYDGGDDLDDCGMSVEEYSIPDWYYKAYLMDDCRFQYDPATRELFVPQMIEHELIDRYRVYYFDGEGFAKRGNQPHKGLHGDLHEYKKLLKFIRTKDYQVRIDLLENGKIRYASWKSPNSISTKPDIVIEGGTYDQEKETYTFRNGEYSYIIEREVIWETDGTGHSSEYLIVKKNGKIILKQMVDGKE